MFSKIDGLIKDAGAIKNRVFSNIQNDRQGEQLTDNDSVSITGESDKKLVLLQIDGLSHKSMAKAMDEGHVPNLAKLVQSDDYKMDEFNCGIASLTLPVQAGMFYGAKAPANIWYDKKADEVQLPTEYMRKGREADYLQFTERTNENGLLEGGLSVCSPLSGGADETVSTPAVMLNEMEEKGKVRTTTAEALKLLKLLRKDNHSLTKVGKNLITDLVKYQRKINEVGSFNHKADKSNVGKISLTKNVLEGSSTSAIKDGVERGLPVMYANYTAYDAVCHYFGPDDDETLSTLDRIDGNIGEILKQVDESEDNYSTVIFGDHGMNKSPAFQDLYGKPLVDVVKDYAAESSEITGEAFDEDDIVFGDVASVGNIYFRFSKDRLDITDIDTKYPGLDDKLVEHPGISMVCGKQDDHVIIRGKGGSVDIAPDETYVIKGENPLKQYGRENDLIVGIISSYVNRENVGDLVLMSNYDDEKDEAVKFSTRHSFHYSHGGLGGSQNEPFIIAESGLNAGEKNISSPEQLGDFFREILES
jgi:hypothetical protein